MEEYKSSAYNVFIPIEELGEYLLYNTMNGGIEVLDRSLGDFFSSIYDGPAFSIAGFPEHKDAIRDLVEKGYLVDAGLDEKGLLHANYSGKQGQLFDRESSRIDLTIGTTIVCNMGCPYCFEFEKPNKTLKKDEVLDQIITYLDEMIAQSPVKKWTVLAVTWYGGEPLINSQAITKLTPRLQDFCSRHGMSYASNIVTNGLLLNKETWQILKANNVTNVQITIDGPREVHEKKRPLKGKGSNRKNYWQIIENLCWLPEGVNVNIRMNMDRLVVAGIPELLKDLAKWGIWPQRFDSVTFTPSWLRSYEETKESDKESQYLSNEEFFDELQRFRKLKIGIFNEWAEKHGLQGAKLKWVMPELQVECGTWVSPYSLVIDPEGYIHKCWETIHDNKGHIGHVSEGYHLEKMEKYMAYDRFELNETCSGCKYLPVCDQLSCSHQALKYDKPPCTYWKEKTPSALKDQYLSWRKDPDSIVLPKNMTKSNSGHANK
jgi:uncharacterized protein